MGHELFGGVYAGRRVLITGHTGFKGSWLTTWLRSLGAQVTGYALAPPTEPSMFAALALERGIAHTLADVRDQPALATALDVARPEIVFHLAAQPLVRLSYSEPVETYATNVMGTVNLLEAVRRTPTVRAVVVVTSDKCYENRESTHAYTEADRLGGNDPYSSSKACAELVCSAYRKSFFSTDGAARVASARAGNVIGGGDWAADRIVCDCVRALAAAEPLVVRNPAAVRPWQHVLESLSGYLSLGARLWSDDAEGLATAWNFGPSRDAIVTVREVVDQLLQAWGAGEWLEPSGAASPGEGAEVPEAGLLLLDAGLAAERLGWAPAWSLDEAVAQTVAWYKAFYGGAGASELMTLTLAQIERYTQAATAAGARWALAS